MTKKNDEKNITTGDRSVVNTGNISNSTIVTGDISGAIKIFRPTPRVLSELQQYLRTVDALEILIVGRADCQEIGRQLVKEIKSWGVNVIEVLTMHALLPEPEGPYEIRPKTDSEATKLVISPRTPPML